MAVWARSVELMSLCMSLGILFRPHLGLEYRLSDRWIIYGTANTDWLRAAGKLFFRKSTVVVVLNSVFGDGMVRVRIFWKMMGGVKVNCITRRHGVYCTVCQFCYIGYTHTFIGVLAGERWISC